MPSETDAPEPARKDAVASIAAQITKLPNGERALLRRLYLTESSRSRAFAGDGVVIGLLHRAGVTVPLDDRVSTAWDDSRPVRNDAYQAWKLVAHVAAVLSGTGAVEPHAPYGRLGTAMFEAGASPSRMLRLTAARGEALHDQIRLIARRLAQAGTVPVNLWPIYHLVGDNPDAAEQARIRLAQDYQAAARQEGDTK